jgi:hypothetical protein
MPVAGWLMPRITSFARMGRPSGPSNVTPMRTAGPARPGSSRNSAPGAVEVRGRDGGYDHARRQREASEPDKAQHHQSQRHLRGDRSAEAQRRSAPPIEPSPGVSQARLRLQAQGQRRGESDPTCFIVPRSTDAMMLGCAEAAARSSCCRSSARQGMAATRKPGRKRRRRARGTRTFGVARTCPSDNPDS